MLKSAQGRPYFNYKGNYSSFTCCDSKLHGIWRSSSLCHGTCYIVCTIIKSENLYMIDIHQHSHYESHSNSNWKYSYNKSQQDAFFFFSRRYNPRRVLAWFTISFHNLLSLHFSLQFLTFILFKSSSTWSSQLSLGLPIGLDEHVSHFPIQLIF